jgi:hypothetical protein
MILDVPFLENWIFPSDETAKFFGLVGGKNEGAPMMEIVQIVVTQRLLSEAPRMSAS